MRVSKGFLGAFGAAGSLVAAAACGLLIVSAVVAQKGWPGFASPLKSSQLVAGTAAAGGSAPAPASAPTPAVPVVRVAPAPAPRPAARARRTRPGSGVPSAATPVSARRPQSSAGAN